jgi:rhodanese-related sulfurtransferase
MHLPMTSLPELIRSRLIGHMAKLPACAAVLLALAACGQAPDNDALRVGLDEGRALFESRQVMMVDIREASEHATGVANGAVLLPMSQLQQRLGEIPRDPAQPVLIICNTQNRSSKVVQAMKDAGWENVRYVHGGMSAWARNGWPMVRPFGASGS